MAQGFGGDAADWAQRLPKSLQLVAADLPRGAAALARVRDLKRNGQPIAGSMLLPDLRSKIAAALAPRLLAYVADPDERTALFAALAVGAIQLDGAAQATFMTFDPGALNGAREFLAATDIGVARSSLEADRIASLTGYFADTIVLAAPRDTRVPLPPREAPTREGIVVWAPLRTRDHCLLIAQGLDMLRLPVTIVCAEAIAESFGLRARFLPAADAADALARALVIVDAEPYDPGSARALAAYRVPLVTAWTSGAHEWLRPVYSYLPWDARTVFNATMAALGGRPSRAAKVNDGVGDVIGELQSVADSLPREGPLVSVIVPTYNRRERLPRALESIVNQRYRAVEIVVVNDGGDDVSDIVAAFPSARLIVNERNLGVMPSLNVGIAAAKGKYISLLADDDSHYPEHIGRLVAALEYSGLPIAHSREMIRHCAQDSGGETIVRGHHIGAPQPTFPPDILINNHISGPGAMFRTSVFSDHGYFDNTFVHGSDFDMWMRLSSRYDFAYVNRVTVEVSMRDDDASQISNTSGSDIAKLLERIYDHHPVAGRVSLERRRREHVAFIAAQTVFRSFPAQVLDPTDFRELELSD